MLMTISRYQNAVAISADGRQAKFPNANLELTPPDSLNSSSLLNVADNFSQVPRSKCPPCENVDTVRDKLNGSIST
jgi:hypothetical protein